MKDSHVESQQRLKHIEQAIAGIEKFVTGETMEKDLKELKIIIKAILRNEFI